jgi:HK97 family phage prohead protease
MNRSLIERRDVAVAPHTRLDCRADEPATIAGYGAVFYDGRPSTQYQIWEDFVERVMPRCFNRAIREDDVRSFFNHNENLVLGRKDAGTLKLSVDRVGLHYEVTPPATESAQCVVESVRRRDVTGSSFMFLARDVVWREEDGVAVRELHDVLLVEVGPVVFPAYAAATSEVRSRLVGEAARAGVRLAGGAPGVRIRQRMLALRARELRF